ncbi:MAG: hypothetical protein GTO03_07685 [Planctomycetales bacterium]|nr:hypothetical protein [Planctomycetales bacterium]
MAARSSFYFFLAIATLLVLIPASPLLAGSADPLGQTPPPTRPWLAAVHPAIFALFQLLVSLTALLAFPPRR